MKRIVSICLGGLSVIAILATAAMTYISGYYIDEYDSYTKSLDYAVIYFAVEFILVLLIFLMLALVLTKPYKKQRFLLISQSGLVLLTFLLTVSLYFNFLIARHQIDDHGGNTEIYLNDFK